MIICLEAQRLLHCMQNTVLSAWPRPDGWHALSGSRCPASQSLQNGRRSARVCLLWRRQEIAKLTASMTRRSIPAKHALTGRRTTCAMRITSLSASARRLSVSTGSAPGNAPALQKTSPRSVTSSHLPQDLPTVRTCPAIQVDAPPRMQGPAIRAPRTQTRRLLSTGGAIQPIRFLMTWQRSALNGRSQIIFM